MMGNMTYVGSLKMLLLGLRSTYEIAVDSEKIFKLTHYRSPPQLGARRRVCFGSPSCAGDQMTDEKPDGAAGGGRVFLLLQGPMSWFFTYLGEALRARGAEVHRILLCPGDVLFWRGPNGVSYRGRARDWPIYVDAFMKNRDVTDLACLGDGRRWHEDAIASAKAEGTRVHVVEQGYLRPHRLTVEPGGTGGHTSFPDDWEEIEALAARTPPIDARAFRAPFRNYAAMDVAFNLANMLFSGVFFQYYRRHALEHPAREWAGWIRRKALPYRRRRREATAAETRVAGHAGPLYLLPLQLETDYQIRLHGPAGGVEAMLRRAIVSFANHAPDDALLVVKVHPLDHQPQEWMRLVGWTSQEAGCAGRCLFLDGGDLDALLGQAAGVVVANSTVGLSALRAGAPVIALGAAIYDLQGLTFGGELDDFWAKGAPPDADRLATLIDALSAIQVPGGFDGEGAKPGADAMAAKMLAPPPY